MRVKHYLRWELLLALSLVGCTSVVPNRIGLPQLPTTGAAEVQPPVTPAGLNLGTRLLFQVRWPAQPGYGTQAIPGLTEKIEVKIVKGGLEAVAANLVKAETMVRPIEGAGNTTTATFNLDPALKVVDVHVRALAADGTVLSSGKRLGVPVRDNTTTGVTVTLSPTGDLPDMDQARITDHLRLLRDLPVYFKDYDQLVRYPDSPEVKELTSSLQTTFGEWMPKPVQPTYPGGYMPSPYPSDYKPGPNPDGTYPSPYPSDYKPSPNPDGTYPTPSPVGATPIPYPSGDSKATAYRAASRYTTMTAGTPERLYNPSNPSQGMEILDGKFQKLFWPGYMASVKYLEDVSKHVLQAQLTPQQGGGDGTSANLHAELSATSWVAEPSLVQSIDALLDPQSTTKVTRQVTFLAGKRPVDATITGGRLAFSVVPKGITANTFSFGASADTFRDISNTPLYLAMTEKSVSSRQVTVAPRHAQFVANAPSAAATADVTVNDDLLGLKSRVDLRLRKNAGGFGAFLVELGGSMRLGPIGDHTEPVGGNAGFSLLDAAQQLRLEGSVQVQRIPFTATVIARFVDVPSNTVIGTIDYVLPVDANGKVDMNHLDSWPVLKLVDSQNTQFRLTPGFFSGETNGFVRVDVR